MNKRSELEADTGFTLADWKAKSQVGELCGILGCFKTPVTQCPHCRNHYCNEHKWVIDTPAHPH